MSFRKLRSVLRDEILDSHYKSELTNRIELLLSICLYLQKKLLGVTFSYVSSTVTLFFIAYNLSVNASSF